MPKTPLFDRCGGYRKLHSFTFATMIHLGTISFCRRFISYREDPLGKTAGQMVGAARSGRQNIIEASERSATSKETEIKLTDVARASLGELLGDYEIYLAAKNVLPWAPDDPQRRKLSALVLPSFEYADDPLHDYWRYYHEVKTPFLPFVESKDDVIAANTMIVITGKAMAMIKSQLATLGDSFLENGGFRERMYQCRTEKRDNAPADGQAAAPGCPECGKPMRRRTARNGKNAGDPFWGCSGYPECRAIQPIKE